MYEEEKDNLDTSEDALEGLDASVEDVEKLDDEETIDDEDEINEFDDTDNF
ncbi:hypothetical protein KJ991_02125 [Patescibacteria group bacterium]|nr:hypothetical protein [Patescibacteria group bacterium]MBU4115661.1 hypothetical protein [Patescibacteria group bacterium]